MTRVVSDSTYEFATTYFGLRHFESEPILPSLIDHRQNLYYLASCLYHTCEARKLTKEPFSRRTRAPTRLVYQGSQHSPKLVQGVALYRCMAFQFPISIVHSPYTIPMSPTPHACIVAGIMRLFWGLCPRTLHISICRKFNSLALKFHWH